MMNWRGMVKFVAERLPRALFWPQPQLVLIRLVSVDHPWSGDPNRQQLRWPNMPMHRIFVPILLLFIALTAAETGLAQTTVPPDPEIIILSRPTVEALSADGLETAKDYQDFIDRLEKVAYDYQVYFSQVEDFHARKYEGLLQKMILEINDGAYCSDFEALSDDLENLIEDLDEHQDHFRNDVGDPKLYKLSRQLLRELEVYYDELHDEILERMVEEANRKRIEKYLVKERGGIDETRKIYMQTLVSHARLLEEVKKAIAELELEKAFDTEEYRELSVELADLAREIENWQLVKMDSDLVLIVPPEAPVQIEAPPLPPLPTRGPRDRYTVLESGDAAVTREYIDSIDVPSTKLPIFISSETGDLIVTGWSQNKILVRFDVEIAAETKQSAKAFASEIQVKLFSNDKGLYLKTHFPSLSDPKRRVEKSQVTVKVPSGNMLTCENSFGTVVITGVEAGLKLNTNYCDVRLDEVHGPVEAANKMNPLKITNSSGAINLRNSLAPIVVKDCEGDFDIENSYASVEVRDCSGRAVVRNSGLVFFGGHTGDVTIENSNGTLQVSELAGNLRASSSYKPMTITDVEGSVNLENQSGSIDVSYISGQATIRNRFGSISGRFIGGPIQVNNESGTVSLEIAEALSGASYVNAVASTVHLRLFDESNVLLNAVTEGGLITGSPGKVIYSGDNTRSTRISYGKASTPLEVKASASTIVIGERDGI